MTDKLPQKIDQLYAEKRFSQKGGEIPKFTFNRDVVSVFDDMVQRSVPHYSDILYYSAELAQKFYQPETCLYDLGSSTGNFVRAFLKLNESDTPRITAVDSSPEMVEQFKQNIKIYPNSAKVEALCASIQDLNFKDCSVVIMNYTMQFIDPELRAPLMEKIYKALLPGGCLILSEKTSHPNSIVHNLEYEFYYAYKREHGYSDLEISSKRDALDEYLVPDSIEKNLSRMQGAGFDACHVWFSWFNFSSFLGIKSHAK